MTDAGTLATMNRAARESSVVGALDDANWRGTALGLLTVRVVHGFIYWGGGSRRFIFDPEKLDPSAHNWMANKLQDAMPGALFGTDQAISFLLKHFDLLYATIIVFSAAELLAGMMLIVGFMTRAAACASLGFSIALMVMFGWIGAVCLEGWTMAACNIAMACALMLNGSGAYSLDNLLLRRRLHMATHRWFRWTTGSLPLPLSEGTFQKLALLDFFLATIFVVGLYSHYRGAVLTSFHPGPVSPSVTHFSVGNARVSENFVSLHAYLDAGTPEAPAFIVEAAVEDGSGKILARWGAAQLAALPSDHIKNEYAYNQVVPGPHGLIARMGAKAEIRLPLEHSLPATAPNAVVRLIVVDGQSFRADLKMDDVNSSSQAEKQR
ncbi:MULTISPECIES: TQO small subunit DoxD [unclassified Mesorhizobium]|uniref:TQO small subunit DoxD n=1 Tax=unclassified Mesorhizobium TaxID=325217 RepID=UPI000BB03CBB|nr:MULTISPECIES: TQO small subunit DoxD [unclassified Mesorhizobium]PBB27420.1 quinol oxidase [Mesorhizobium sp. WSM4304]PBB77022.1 quinol oxidase [Mesorhizobium sp. WSM4308]